MIGQMGSLHCYTAAIAAAVVAAIAATATNK